MTSINDLPPHKLAEYRQMGYNDQEIQQALNELDQEQQGQGQSALQASYAQAMMQQQQDARSYASNTLVSANAAVNQNLVQWQLELDSILERVEHMLRGDKPHFVNGSLIFVPPSSNEGRIFTDFGVGEVMRILSMYLNRNTILSNYDEKTINFKVYDFGREVSDLIYLKYEVMFATLTFEECYNKIFKCNKNLVQFETNVWKIEEHNEENGETYWRELTPTEFGLTLKEFRTQRLEKRKLYPMIVRELVDTVHSSYLRALHGGERQSLHEARQVTQTESLMPGVNINTGQVPKERGILNPARWFGGKY